MGLPVKCHKKGSIITAAIRQSISRGLIEETNEVIIDCMGLNGEALRCTIE